MGGNIERKVPVLQLTLSLWSRNAYFLRERQGYKAHTGGGTRLPTEVTLGRDGGREGGLWLLLNGQRGDKD